MRQHLLFSILMMILFVGCSVSTVQTTSTPPIAATATRVIPLTTVTVTQPVESTVMSTAMVGASHSCPDIQPIGSPVPPLAGTLVVDSRWLDPNFLLNPSKVEGDVYLMDMQTLETQVLPRSQVHKGAVPDAFNISPDLKKFIYLDQSVNSANQLRVGMIDGTEFTSAYWDDSWGSAVSWFDNQRLIIRPVNEWRDGVVIILDPGSGEWRKVEHEFPSGLNSFFPYVAYNFTLTRGSYLSGDNLVLWDIPSGTDLLTLPTRSPEFAWRLPQRDMLAVVVRRGDSSETIHDELSLVDQDGHETQITHLAQAFPSAQSIEIKGPIWSPDGKYIAFRLSLDDPEGIERPQLAVVDLETQQVTSYCFVVPLYAPILWSPDSGNVIITVPVDYGEYKKTIDLPVRQRGDIILVNIEDASVIRVAENTTAVGWMLPP